MANTKNWNSTYETQPTDTDNPKYGDDNIRSTRIGVRERLEKEHVAGIAEAYAGHGWHRPGSAMTFCQAAAPATMNDTDSNGGSGLTALGNDTKSIGRLWVDTDTAIMYYWTGTAWVALAGTDPIGTVKFFHGAWSDNVTIPGWYECTAANAAAQGTVNGAGRILMGVALATYTDESTGGAVTATLATANLASHTHTGPSHTHAGNDLTVSNGTHTHTAAVQMDYVPIQEGTGADHVVLLGGNTTGTLGSVYHFVMADGSGAHTNHAVSGTTTAGGTGATGSSGSATAFSILNPYLVLHMIERRS